MSITLGDIASGYNLSLINSNFQEVEEYINSSLVHRNGTTPGETLMNRDLDMNSNHILNLPFPADPTSPLRRIDLDWFINANPIPETNAGVWMTTSALGIGVDPGDSTTDNSAAFQAAVNLYPNLYVNTYINLRSPIDYNLSYGKVRGSSGGRIRIYGTTMAANIAIRVFGQYNVFDNLVFDNPTETYAHTGGRQGFWSARNHYNTIQNCVFFRGLNSVTADALSAPIGTKVIGNYFLECLGDGKGQNDTEFPSNGSGEDRGDAVTLWNGGGGLIAFNTAIAKAGVDARVGFHAERLTGSPPTNPDALFDYKGFVIIGNQVWGGFRRHYAMEHVQNSVCMGNTSNGGATWWGESYIQCYNTYVENTIYYTRSTETAGLSFSPTRAAIAVMNFSQNLTVNSKVRMVTGSVGRGLVTQTKTSGFEHRFTFGGTIVNEGSTANDAISVLYPEMFHVKAAHFKGFANLFAAPTDATTNVWFDDVHADLNGTGTYGVRFTSGVGGSLVVNGGTLTGVGGTVFSTPNLGTVHINGVVTSTTVDAFFADLNGTTQAININGNTNVGTTKLNIRVNTVTDGAFLSNIPMNISGNSGIQCGVVGSSTLLGQATSSLNQTRSTGQFIYANGHLYVSRGISPTAVWTNLTGGTNITPV